MYLSVYWHFDRNKSRNWLLPKSSCTSWCLILQHEKWFDNGISSSLKFRLVELNFSLWLCITDHSSMTACKIDPRLIPFLLSCLTWMFFLWFMVYSFTWVTKRNFLLRLINNQVGLPIQLKMQKSVGGGWGGFSREREREWSCRGCPCFNLHWGLNPFKLDLYSSMFLKYFLPFDNYSDFILTSLFFHHKHD